jgi:hypothetical protein
MCDKLRERVPRHLLEKTNNCKQNNYVIDQTMTEHFHKVPVRLPQDRDNLGDIKKPVATKRRN